MFIEIGCTKCNCKLTLLCICTDRRQMMGTNGIKGVWRSFKQGIHSKNASFKSYGVIYICNIVNSIICLLIQLSRSNVSLMTGASVISLQTLIVSSALLETQVNVRSSKILSHSSLSFCTSRILLLSMCCITTPNSK